MNWKREFKEWFKLWRPFFFQSKVSVKDMLEIESYISTEIIEKLLRDAHNWYSPLTNTATEEDFNHAEKQLRDKWL